MKNHCLQLLLSFCTLLASLPSLAAPTEFQIAVIAHPADEAALRDTLAATDAANLAFVVAGGIKSAQEPCSDEIYERRRNQFEASKNGLIVAVAASDWSDCLYSNGRTAALERLNRLRELFFSGDFSLGASKLPLMRQSANAKFRSYSENVRWEFGNVLFATVNLPANNNRYLAAAGRNGEFEDRLVANNDWLQRLFVLARRNQVNGIVLFCDGEPLNRADGNSARDGFAETRKQLSLLAEKFSGRILIVHNGKPGADDHAGNIVWNNNLGSLSLAGGVTRLAVSPSRAMPFRLVSEALEKPESAQ